MAEIWPGGDRYTAEITIPGRGDFSYAIESYDHPLATWLHDAEIKIAADVDAELMCAIGAALFEEVITKDSSAKSLLKPAVSALNDSKLAPLNRFGIASTPEIRNYCVAHPLRCLLYTSPSPRDRSVSRMPSSA